MSSPNAGVEARHPPFETGGSTRSPTLGEFYKGIYAHGRAAIWFVRRVMNFDDCVSGILPKRTSSTTSNWSVEELEHRMALALLAGAVAELHAGGLTAEGSVDLSTVHDGFRSLLGEQHGDEKYGALLDVTAQLVHENWRFIRLVADAFLRGKVSPRTNAGRVERHIKRLRKLWEIPMVEPSKGRRQQSSSGANR